MQAYGRQLQLHPRTLGCGAGWLGTIMVSEYKVGKWRKRQKSSCVGEKDRSEDSSEEPPDMGGLLATWGNDDILVLNAAKDQVWVCGPGVAAVICVDIHGICYYQGPSEHPKGLVTTWDHVRVQRKGPCHSKRLALPPGFIVMFQPRLLLRAVSGPMTQLQPVSPLISVATVATEGCADAHGVN